MSKIEETNIHNNAAALIVAAAEESGLLKEVAEALCFIDKHPIPESGCGACELHERLAEAFSDHRSLAAGVISSSYFNDCDIYVGPYTEAELAPYLNTNSRRATDSHITLE